METFAFQLQNFPNNITTERIKYFCSLIAPSADNCKYDLFNNTLYLEFNKYDDYVQSYIDAEKLLNDDKSGIILHDLYSFRTNLQLDIRGELLFSEMAKKIIEQYKGKMNIGVSETGLSFIPNEIFKDLVKNFPSADLTFFGDIDGYFLTLTFNNSDDNIKLNLYSNDYLSLINVLEKIDNVNGAEAFNSVRDIERRKKLSI